MENHYEITQEEYEKIERYLTNEMAPEEQEAFSQEIASNIVLEKKVEQMRLIIIGIRESALEKRTAAFHSELYPTVRRRAAFGTRKILLIAASVIALVVIGYFIVIGNKDQDDLFNAYFKPDPGLETTMGTTETYAFSSAMVSYKTGEFEKAILGWKSLHANNPTNDTLNYFIGLAYLADEKAEQAIPFLTSSLNTTGGAFTSEANWYLGLAYLKTGDHPKARNYLMNSDHPLKQEILTKIDK